MANMCLFNILETLARKLWTHQKSDHDVKTPAMSATQSAMNFDTEHSIMDKERMVKSKLVTQRAPSLLQPSMLNRHGTCGS